MPTTSIAEPYPLGTRVRKINSEPNDGHRDGDTGVITVHPSILTASGNVKHWLGPITKELAEKSGSPELVGQYGYFVQFDDLTVPVGITGNRIEPI